MARSSNNGIKRKPVHRHLSQKLFYLGSITQHFGYQSAVRFLQNLMFRLKPGQLFPHLLNCRICVHMIVEGRQVAPEHTRALISKKEAQGDLKDCGKD